MESGKVSCNTGGNLRRIVNSSCRASTHCGRLPISRGNCLQALSPHGVYSGGLVEEGLRLRQALDGFQDFRVARPVGALGGAPIEGAVIHLPTDAALHPILLAVKFGVRESDLFRFQECAKTVQHFVVRLPTRRKLRFLGAEVGRGEAIKRIRATWNRTKPALEDAVLRRRILLVGSDSPTTVYLTATIRRLHILRFGVGFLAGVVVFEERLVRIVPLDQPAAGGVIVRDGQQQRGSFRQRKLRLYQALTEGCVAHDPRAVVILQRSRYDFRSGGDCPFTNTTTG